MAKAVDHITKNVCPVLSVSQQGASVIKMKPCVVSTKPHRSVTKSSPTIRRHADKRFSKNMFSSSGTLIIIRVSSIPLGLGTRISGFLSIGIKSKRLNAADMLVPVNDSWLAFLIRAQSL